jgi:hypothetical protein
MAYWRSGNVAGTVKELLMDDPRLNSMHLDSPRREEFRRARRTLVEARGVRTLAFEQLEKDKGDSFAMSHVQRDPVPPDSDYWLMDQEGTYPLRIGINTIGRHPDNDLVIEGPYVSRRHCAILVHAGDGCELHDIASKNGTYVNGLRLCGPTELLSGDKILMCDRQFTFLSKDGPQPEPFSTRRCTGPL